MKKIAIVVQRCHPNVVGGSEALAWQYASMLKEDFEIEILTTTAIDIATWSNKLSEGLDIIDGIRVHRFSVSVGRSSYWHELHQKLLEHFKREKNLSNNFFPIPWSTALQEEFIRHQGPHSKDMVQFIQSNWEKYATVIFVTYLYPTTYFGIQQVPRSNFILVPTLHDEAPAYLNVYKYMARKAKNIIWLTEAEKELSNNLWGKLSGQVIAMSIDTQLYTPAKTTYRYILYSGRIDENKGCKELFEAFIRFKQENPSSLRLILTGKSELQIPDYPDIEYRGFVSPEEKFQLMAGASAFVMPSALESFSIATLEAMAQKTPVIVNSLCSVLADHIKLSNGGGTFINYHTFSCALKEILNDTQTSEAMGISGRNYVLSNYSYDVVRQRLVDLVNQCLN
jgi:glycosyltransferase involved in cell wall biosynthesis